MNCLDKFSRSSLILLVVVDLLRKIFKFLFMRIHVYPFGQSISHI